MSFRHITRHALAIPIIWICFLLFKGPLNILNALFIPVTIFLFTYSASRKERIMFYMAVILFYALFYNVQLFFIAVYCIIAAALTVIHKRRMNFWAAIPILTLITGLCFWVGIVATDAVFLTEINGLMNRLVGNNLFYYFGIILIEAGFVSVLMYHIANFFLKSLLHHH